MTQNIVLAIVILVSVWAHIWLYMWMRFKMDEGAITRCLKDASTSLTAPDISTQVDLRIERVVKVCCKSKEIRKAGEVYLLD